MDRKRTRGPVTKSCLTCKRRYVSGHIYTLLTHSRHKKCDLRRPTCDRCTKGNYPCHYDSDATSPTTLSGMTLPSYDASQELVTASAFNQVPIDLYILSPDTWRTIKYIMAHCTSPNSVEPALTSSRRPHAQTHILQARKIPNRHTPRVHALPPPVLQHRPSHQDRLLQNTRSSHQRRGIQVPRHIQRMGPPIPARIMCHVEPWPRITSHVHPSPQRGTRGEPYTRSHAHLIPTAFISQNDPLIQLRHVPLSQIHNSHISSNRILRPHLVAGQHNHIRLCRPHPILPPMRARKLYSHGHDLRNGLWPSPTRRIRHIHHLDTR